MKTINLSLILALALLASSAAATIIPAAQPARDHARAPEHSPVIIMEDGQWLLVIPQRPERPQLNTDDKALGTSERQPGTLPLTPRAMEHSRAPEHSPAIDVIEGVWTLTPRPTNLPQTPKSLDPAPDDPFPSIPNVPEPATLLFIAAGSLLLRKRK